MKINGITDIPAGMEYISIDRCGDYEHIEIIRNIKKDDREIVIKTKVENRQNLSCQQDKNVGM